MGEPGRGTAKTLDRGLLVLLAFQHRTEWGVSELARELGLDKAVAHRLLTTLAHRGFVLADPDTRRYRLGVAVGVLARAAERGGALEAAARPLLTALARELGESAVLNVPHGAGYRTALAVDAAGPMRYSAIVGETLPAHGGAAGHAIFAFYPDDDVRRLLGAGPLERFSDTTVTDPNGLRALYARVRRDRVSISHGEYDLNVTSVAAPVFAAGEVVGSLVVIGPHHNVTEKIDTTIARVRGAAESLTRLLDGGGAEE
ncbi:IclR family transcriptional regulator [Actinomadura rifamycini]|uniref:IclR family transcriptional regulator n=1 Tax=Actinomadura rifamycini TaxID=31962 RepID=UPI000408676E|nr:IclR family transcriptional regulator [Actinomadura rifamycini]